MGWTLDKETWKIEPLQGIEPLEHIIHNLRAQDREEAFCQKAYDDPARLTRELFFGAGGMVWIAYSHNEPVAVVGALEIWPGVWSAWMLATDKFSKVGTLVTRFIRKRLIPTLNELGAHRCEARSLASHEEAHRWLESLGAVKEAELKRYGKNGQDFFVYRWDRT